jgi:signal transduction histidine kinase
MVVSIFIAIVKYKLFNVKVIVTELFAILIVVVLFSELFLAKSSAEIIIRTSVLVIVSIFSFLLINGVYREVEQREKIEKLAGELEAANKQLGEANWKLKDLDQLKSEFVSLATHQIRGPLAAIKGFTSLISEGDYGAVPETIKDPLDKIAKSTQSLVLIVEDFLNISNIEQGKIKYNFADVDMKKLVSEVSEEMRPATERAKLDFKFEAEEGKDYTVSVDEGKMKQVVRNLIDNAIKYTPRGKISVSLGKANDTVRLQVADNGIGLSKEMIPRLFQKFSRDKSANKVNIVGTGLGLYVVKQMVEAHHGKIWAKSEGEGKGSRFVVEIGSVKKS